MIHEHTTADVHSDSSTVFGFWIYLMTDLVLFASLFAVYATMRSNTFGGPSAHELFDLPYVLVETLVLLVSSCASGFALLAARKGSAAQVLAWLSATAVLGSVFVGMEVHEFVGLAAAGATWQVSGFLSAYFTLVGTHGLHVTVGLVWAAVLVFAVARRGLTRMGTAQADVVYYVLALS
jgi:cytochrome o ubiquinol oxidase subunit 3